MSHPAKDQNLRFQNRYNQSGINILSSPRDLMKWCQRIAPHFDSSSDTCALRVFQEAMECFCYSLPTMDKRLPVAEAIGARLNVPKPKVEFVMFISKPSLQYQPDAASLTVGRVTLPLARATAVDSVLRFVD